MYSFQRVQYVKENELDFKSVGCCKTGPKYWTDTITAAPDNSTTAQPGVILTQPGVTKVAVSLFISLCFVFYNSQPVKITAIHMHRERALDDGMQDLST